MNPQFHERLPYIKLFTQVCLPASLRQLNSQVLIRIRKCLYNEHRFLANASILYSFHNFYFENKKSDTYNLGNNRGMKKNSEGEKW